MENQKKNCKTNDFSQGAEFKMSGDAQNVRI